MAVPSDVRLPRFLSNSLSLVEIHLRPSRNIRIKQTS
jgi:hypothetical protein